MILFGAYGTISDASKIFKEIDNLSKNNNALIQMVNADVIFGKDHIISAMFHTQRCFANKTNSLDDASLELLLYLSGERQISKAISKIGITNQTTKFAIIVSSEKQNNDEIIVHTLLSQFNLCRDDTVLEGDSTTLKQFGLSKQEISTVSKQLYGDLILEKVALVDIIK